MKFIIVIKPDYATKASALFWALNKQGPNFIGTLQAGKVLLLAWTNSIILMIDHPSFLLHSRLWWLIPHTCHDLPFCTDSLAYLFIHSHQWQLCWDLIGIDCWLLTMLTEIGYYCMHLIQEETKALKSYLLVSGRARVWTQVVWLR